MNRYRKFARSAAFCGGLLLLASGAAFAEGSSSGIIALNSLPNPPATLATARVADAQGTVVGAVQKVVMDASGKPVSVAIALVGSNAIVALDAGAFNYDQPNNMLMTQMDAKEIAQAPRVPG